MYQGVWQLLCIWSLLLQCSSTNVRYVKRSDKIVWAWSQIRCAIRTIRSLVYQHYNFHLLSIFFSSCRGSTALTAEANEIPAPATVRAWGELRRIHCFDTIKLLELIGITSLITDGNVLVTPGATFMATFTSYMQFGNYYIPLHLHT